jgi:hypothetical protein
MKRGFVIGAGLILLSTVALAQNPPRYCREVRYCSVSCGELFNICHNPVQRVTCALAHVLCRIPFGGRRAR